MKRILVTGGRGMLAHDLIPRLENTFHVIPVDLPELDITEENAVQVFIADTRPDCIVNCAAYTAVDKAESEAELAFSVNRDGAGILGERCKKADIPLVHISTDFVFDGAAGRPYCEDDPAGPLSVYGKSKWEGEQAIRDLLDRHIILRTAWLYGTGGNNFVKSMLRLAREREELRVVDDQTGCPTWSGHLADAILRITEQVLQDNNADWGTYHYCGAGQTTWYGFTRNIIETADRYDTFRLKHLIPITTKEYPTPAVRPRWSVLDTSKITRIFGIDPPSWEDGLSRFIEELYQKNTAG